MDNVWVLYLRSLSNKTNLDFKEKLFLRFAAKKNPEFFQYWDAKFEGSPPHFKWFIWPDWKTTLNNSQYAWWEYLPDDPERLQDYLDLKQKYWKPLMFKPNGYPELEPFSISKQEISWLTWGRNDFKLANKKAWYSETPEGYTRHHVEDCLTMLLVFSDVHTPWSSWISHNWWAELIKKWLCK